MSEVVWITNIYCVNGGASKHCTTGMANPLPIYEKIASSVLDEVRRPIIVTRTM